MEETELAVYEHGAEAAGEVAEELRDGIRNIVSDLRVGAGNGLEAAVVSSGLTDHHGCADLGWRCSLPRVGGGAAPSSAGG